MPFSLDEIETLFHKKKYFFVALFFIITLLLIAVIAGQDGWGERSEKRIGTTKNFCEMNHEGLVRQPINTFSSFALCIPGFYILWRWDEQTSSANTYFEHGTSPLNYKSIETMTFAITCILVGLGAAAAHGTQSKEGSTLDVFSMMLWLLFPMIFTICRINKYNSFSFFSGWVIISLFGIITLKSGLFVDKMGVGDFYMIAIPVWMLIEAFTIKIGLRNLNKWLIIGTLSFAVGYLLWLFDQTEAGCDSYSLFQWHAVWHILCAYSMYSFWHHLRMENKID